ncbi:MAG: hypothetical protein IJ325_01445 [Clostridia bacterium]|nr:hypothetical protein [Clostridia bacterium]
MLGKWILGVMTVVILLAFLVPFCPDVLVSLGSASGGPDITVFLWIVNLGIVAAVLCIVLFLLYTIVDRSRKH